jgi:hypothetical protein
VAAKLEEEEDEEEERAQRGAPAPPHARKAIVFCEIRRWLGVVVAAAEVVARLCVFV